MTRTEVSFDDYEAECLAFLGDHFDRKGESVDIDEFPRYEEFGRDKVMETIKRFRRFNLIEFQSRATIKILPEILEVIEQLRVRPIPAETASPNRLLRVFLCHGSEDKPAVRDLYKCLREDGIDPWLDEENILPGQDWDSEIRKSVRNSDVILVCLSSTSVKKSGYIQKEIKFALDVADEQPEDTIFLIPVKLDDCEIPRRLKQWQWVALQWEWTNLVDEAGYNSLIKSLRTRAESLDIQLFYQEDKRLLEKFRIAFDRPAFRGTFLWQTDPHPFKEAMELTLKAITTGVLQDRGGTELARIAPLSEIKDPSLRSTTEAIVTRLKRASNLITILEESQKTEKTGDVIEEIDKERDDIIAQLNNIWTRLGIPQLPIPTQITDSTDVWEQFS